jgi:hypothetical protein
MHNLRVTSLSHLPSSSHFRLTELIPVAGLRTHVDNIAGCLSVEAVIASIFRPRYTAMTADNTGTMSTSSACFDHTQVATGIEFQAGLDEKYAIERTSASELRVYVDRQIGQRPAKGLDNWVCTKSRWNLQPPRRSDLVAPCRRKLTMLL